MNLSSLARIPALAILIAALALDGGQSARAQDDVRVYEVTITNLSSGQLLSPPVIATHARDFSLFEIGAKASEGVWTVAEQGNPNVLAEQLRASPEVDTVSVADGPVHRVGGSGPASMTVRVESHGADRLSVAMMLGCTNDGFTGLSAVPLSRSMLPATYYVGGYDAGTEMNTQVWTDMPDGCNALGPAGHPADGMNARVLTDEPISMHPGIVVGQGDLTEAHRFDEPVVRITVQRIE
jgi:hypothetical protein